MVSIHERNNGVNHAVVARSSTKTPQRKWTCSWAKLTAISIVVYLSIFLYFLLSFQMELSHDSEETHPLLDKPNRDATTSGQKNRIPPKKNDSVNTMKKGLPDFSTRMRPFQFDRKKAEEALLKFGVKSIQKTLTAYLEPPMKDTVPGTGNQGDENDSNHVGIPPDFVIPLPLRQNSPEDLIKMEYPSLKTCLDVPSKLPVDRGFQLDKDGNPLVWNVGNEATSDTFPMDEASYCPVDADPFLPWLHDVFPTVDGTKVVFIAQNKRRCNTGKEFRKDLMRLEPQVALMQPVSVKRLDETVARELAPELWYPTNDDERESLLDTPPRYRLAPMNESDQDGQFTRFICRFHTIDFSMSPPRTVVLAETLSVYPFNYEFVTWRKSHPTMITPRGQDNRFFWLSHLRFECPVPVELQPLVASGETVLSDMTPTLHVDVIPIRTSPRFGTKEVYFTEEMAGPRSTWGVGDVRTLWSHGAYKSMAKVGFDAAKRWGSRHVLPRVEASGRWENIPICLPPRPGKVEAVPPNHDIDPKETRKMEATDSQKAVLPTAPGGTKPFLLSACVWTAASFKTRGVRKGPITDTLDRLEEWLEWHFMVGFDHVFVYDNSGAHTNETSLAPILAKYPPSKVTRVDWPSIVCNNNIPAHDNTGERSSQYAAENSCRTRFAPYTEWIASIDTDEYLIPMGKYGSMKEVVRDAAKRGTNILSFRSTRAKLREDCTEDFRQGRRKLDNVTYLEAYNCDSSPVPKPDWADRARKQLYRADYVPYHFVHYSTVTNNMLTTYKDSADRWRRSYQERKPSERVTDEVNEAVMLHAKTTTVEDCGRWRVRCRYDFEKKWRGCPVGFPWPNDTPLEGKSSHRDDGMEYNCFPVKNLTEYWIPRLRENLAKRKSEQTKK